eukprot:4429625-Pleurochrysis_carterae.AAC.1
MGARNKKNKKGTTSGAQGDDDDEEGAKELAVKMEKLTAEHAEELKRVKSKCKEAMAAMEA